MTRLLEDNSGAAWPRRASLIAGANAWFRAWESERPVPERILSDPWALRLASRNFRLLMMRILRRMIPPLGRVIRELAVAHCVRHRAIDELLLTAIRKDHFTQVVVLGAGYDMRPSRFVTGHVGVGGAVNLDTAVQTGGDLRWIEIDDARTQTRKWSRLKRQGGVRVVSHQDCDLERERLDVALARAGFDPARPTCFVLEGLIHYLTPGAVALIFDTFATVGAPVRVIFSCIDLPMRRSATPILTSLFRATGEIPRSFMAPAQAAAIFEARGFSSFMSWSFDNQIDKLLPAGLRERRRSLHSRWWQTVAQADRPAAPRKT